MGGLLHSFDMKLQEKRLYNWIQDFSHKRVKKFWWTPTINAEIEKSVVFPVIKTQNTTLLDESYAVSTNFAVNNKNAEFVRKIFLTNSA